MTDGASIISTIEGNLVRASGFETAALMRRTAQTRDIDELGHVNNAVYLVWTQDIAVAHWRALAPSEMRDAFVWVALRHEIDYRDEIRAGDAVEVRTWLGRVAGPRYERFVDIRKEGAKRFSASVRTDWCLIDAASRKPKRVTAEILAPFGF